MQARFSNSWLTDKAYAIVYWQKNQYDKFIR